MKTNCFVKILQCICQTTSQLKKKFFVRIIIIQMLITLLNSEQKLLFAKSIIEIICLKTLLNIAKFVQFVKKCEFIIINFMKTYF